MNLHLIEFGQGHYGDYTLMLFFDVSTAPFLLYGWVLPVSGDNHRRNWFKIDGKQAYRHLFSMHIVLSAEVIQRFVGLLTQGSAFNDACKLSDVPEFADSAKYAGVSDWTLPQGKYVARPTVVYRALPEYAEQKNYYFYSPSKNSIAEVEALFCLDKEPFLTRIDIVLLCQYLQAKTGIQFTRSQFARIGNIEWFEFPCTDVFDSNWVTYQLFSHPSEKNVVGSDGELISISNEVVVTLSEPLTGAFWVNMECLNANASVLNEIKALDTKDTRSVRFVTREVITRIKVKIWACNESSSKLIFQDSASFIRSIHMAMHPVTGSATIESRKTFNLKKSISPSRHNEITEREMVTLSPSMPTSVIKREGNDPWRDVILDVNDQIKVDPRFLPPSDSSVFLPKGWEGSVAFMDWYQKIGRKYDVGQVILVDPYADEEALLFLSRIGLSGVNFEILANSFVRSDAQMFINNLSSFFAKLSQKLYMLSFRYYDIPASKKIHDRYMIVKDKQGVLKSGFHLSNSIQGANSEFPLLITEIPLVILYEVDAWLKEQLSDEQTVKLVFDSASVREQSRVKYIEIDKDQFFMSEDEIVENVSEDWENICDAAHNNNLTVQNLELASERFSDNQWYDIFLKVRGILLCPITHDNDRQEFSFYHVYNPTLSLVESYKNGMQSLNYGHHTAFEVLPSVFYFVKVALKLAPEKLVELLDFATENFSATNFTGTLFAAVTSSLFWGHHQGLTLMNTKNHFIQGFICGQIYTELLQGKINFDEATQRLNGLTTEQKLVAVSIWVYELRISQNRQGMDEHKTNLFLKIFDFIILLWPEDSSLLYVVFELCSGPIVGSHADSTANGLLLPLLKEDKLEINRLWRYFESIFNDKIMDKHVNVYSDYPFYATLGYFSQLIDKKHFVNFENKLNQIIRKQKIVLNQPFIRSYDYEQFSLANAVVHSVLFACYSMRTNAPNVNEYSEIIEKLKEYLIQRGIYLQHPNSELVDFMKRSDL